MKVLIVENDPKSALELNGILVKKGFEVAAVSSARDALQELEKAKVEVIISDIVMPGMDGMEPLNNVKTNFPEIRMLMITGHSGKYGKESVMEAGADGFISKPFKNIEITRTIQKLIDI